MDTLREMLKGVLEGMILEIIGKGEVYGYQIQRILRELGLTDIAEGTVYTILVRLEKNQLVNIAKKPSDLGPDRKFYTLNQRGRSELALFWARWNFIADKIENLKGGQQKWR